MELKKHFSRTDISSFLSERRKVVDSLWLERKTLEKKFNDALPKEEKIIFSMPIEGNLIFFQTAEDKQAFIEDRYVSHKPHYLKEIVVYYQEGCRDLFPSASLSMGFKVWKDDTGYHQGEPIINLNDIFDDEKLQYGTHSRNSWFFLDKEGYEKVKEILTFLSKELSTEDEVEVSAGETK